jgi:hypothetical protein
MSYKISIEISLETDKLIRRMSRMDDTHDNVIKRGFTFLDNNSEFWNLE